MRIVVNHLTRMSAGKVCAAGICVETGEHVRPEAQARTQLCCDDLRANGGLFAFGAEVDLGDIRSIGVRPHIEDAKFKPARARTIRDVPASEFWQLVRKPARDRLADIFGPTLRKRGQTDAPVLPEGKGDVSLGLLRPSALLGAKLDDRDRPRQIFADCDASFDVPLNDIRFFTQRQGEWKPNKNVLAAVANRLLRKERALVAVGLTRAYHSVHWVQVNGVFFRDSPLSLVDTRPAP